MDKDNHLGRLVRIETRLARLQENAGLPTRMTPADVNESPYNDDATTEIRLMRIETRVYRLLEAMNLNPRTGMPK
jgi:hypothetical protein